MKSIIEKIKKCGILKFSGLCAACVGVILFVVACFIKMNVLSIVGVSLVAAGALVAVAQKVLKRSIVRYIGTVLLAIAVALFAIIFYVNNEKTSVLLMIIGVSLYTIGGIIRAVTSNEHRLIKCLLLLASVPVIVPWLVPSGYFYGGDFVNYGFHRIGLMDIGFGYLYSISASIQTFATYIDKVIYLLLVAGFYGVLAKTEGYKKLTDKCGSLIKKRPILWTIIISVVLFALTSIVSQTFALLIVIPFIYTSLLKANFDKLTAFAISFGSIIVGLLGATYGTEIIGGATSALQNTVSFGLGHRFIIAAIAVVLYNFFLVMRVRKVEAESKKTTKNSTVEDDPFAVETTKSKASCLPVAILFGVIAIFMIISFIGWNTNWNINIFNQFHNWLTSLFKVDDVSMVGQVLEAHIAENSITGAIGEMTFLTFNSAIVFIATILIAVAEKVNVNEFISNFAEGARKATKAVFLMSIIYFMYFLTYWAPFTPVIANYLLNVTSGFNLWFTSLTMILASIFTDAAFIATYIMNFVNSYAANFEIAYSVFTSLNALTQIVVPTSLLLVTGLSLLKVDYKQWLKYIWLYVVGMLVILMVFFEVLLTI